MKILILTLLVLCGCVTTPAHKLNPEVYYKNDLCFSFKDKQSKGFCGVGVAKHQEQYNIKVKTKAKSNLLMLTTCHREIQMKDPDKGIFNKNGVVKIDYKPTEEKGKACPLFVSSYNNKGRHGWGIVALESPRFTLKAKLFCNGSISETNGVSICQSRLGLIQRIEFPEAVKMLTPVNGSATRTSDCPALTHTKDKKIFNFVLPPRECIYGFIGESSGQVHKFYTIGYEEIVIRD